MTRRFALSPGFPDEVSDEALLVAFANGDRQAARDLTLRLTPRVLGQARRMLGPGHDAEDVTQEALMRLWKQAPAWRQGEAQVSTWLYRVVANLCTDRLRKRPRARALDDIDEPVDETPSVAQSLHQATRLEALRGALATLPERQGQAVALRHLEGLSNPEIAEIMGVSPRAVESLTARGKRALASLLAPRKHELEVWDE